jgi:hypothetical protein
MPPGAEKILAQPAFRVGAFVLVTAAASAGFWALFLRTPPAASEPAAAQSPVSSASAMAGVQQGQPPSATRAGEGGKKAPSLGRGSAPGIRTTPSLAVPVEVVAADSPGPSAPVSQAPESAAPSNVQAVLLDGRIYDATASDVTPPTLQTPIAVAVGRRDSQSGPDLAAIEIFVDADGSVVSVKAVGPPSTVGETLELINWLSVTKSWRFDPATRNGLPVRYRLVVPLNVLASGRGLR